MSLRRYLLVRLARIGALALHARVRQLRRLCHHPEETQTRLLLDIIRRQSVTAYGIDHGFSTIATVADYRKQVPISTYEQLSPYIERLKAGETTALLANDRIRLFALTSGTTAARKFIPITDRYLADYKRAWSMWGVRAYRDHRPRDLALRPLVQMVGDPDEFRTEQGIPCGNLSGFTASVQRRIARKHYVVPTECGKISDPAARYYTAVRSFIGLPVALFLAANPSTLLTLARTLDQHRDDLIKDLHDGTLNSRLQIPESIRKSLSSRWKANPDAARRIDQIASRVGRLHPQDLWPSNSILIGTWTGGSMGSYLKLLPQYFGDAPIRDLGLVASEGRFTIPFADGTPSGVLDISSHYYEFIPEAEIDSPAPTVLGAHEVQEGQSYYIIPTTTAGLYRYHISDIVRVTGFLHRTPIVEFLGKGNRFSNLTGEKLSEHHVTQAMADAVNQVAIAINAYTVAAAWNNGQPYYRLFMEMPENTGDNELKQFADVLDRSIAARNMEYEAKRFSGRLGKLRVAILPDGSWHRWDQNRLARTGGSAEQYKRPCLMSDPNFHESFAGIREIDS